MSIWEQQAVEAAVLEALGEVHLNNPAGHHFGRPYLSAYQLAIKVNRAHPQIATELGVSVGGAGTGTRTSLAQYLARVLSQRIKQSPDSYPVEGAFLSNEHVDSVAFHDADGASITSSLSQSGFDLSLFRLRDVSPTVNG
ncbi:hypothetical protein [Dactylosporangium salmoneum]